MKTEMIEPQFETNITGFNYKGRGPSATGSAEGWSKNKLLYFVCAKCGSMMPSIIDTYFTCECDAMHHDLDAFRFGSTLGDNNILVYEKQQHKTSSEQNKLTSAPSKNAISHNFKALLKVVIGFLAIIGLYSLLKSNELNDMIPATTGYNGLFVLAVPILVIIWGIIEIITQNSLGEASNMWDRLSILKKTVFSFITILTGILITFIIIPYIIYG